MIRLCVCVCVCDGVALGVCIWRGFTYMLVIQLDFLSLCLCWRSGQLMGYIYWIELKYITHLVRRGYKNKVASIVLENMNQKLKL
jgi:hypothetical protein